ncbi:unnamed protein product [Durusdinium trenchii]|uniref:C3H1-type domain-containing protein n=1 Tax=Durusdinium trenchii TaxID=1381693 RepID=A0ABP0NYB9_9DINO
MAEVMVLRFRNSFIDIADDTHLGAQARASSAPPLTHCSFEGVLDLEQESNYVDILSAQLGSEAMSAWRPLEEKASYNAVEDFAGATEPEAIEEAGGAPSGGSLGHPQVCNRPCIYFAAGNCASGAGCSYCHVEHTEKTGKLDKRQRQLLQELSKGQVMGLIYKPCKERAEDAGFLDKAAEILKLVQDGSTPISFGDRRLLKPLQKFSFGCMIRLVSKRDAQLSDALERLRESLG